MEHWFFLIPSIASQEDVHSIMSNMAQKLDEGWEVLRVDSNAAMMIYVLRHKK